MLSIVRRFIVIRVAPVRVGTGEAWIVVQQRAVRRSRRPPRVADLPHA
jgi:hypothetical protein